MPTQVPQVTLTTGDGTSAVSSAGVLNTAYTVPGGAVLWTASAVGVGGTSGTAAVSGYQNFLILGTSSAATTISVQVLDALQSGSYRTSTVSIVLAGAGDFVLDCRPLVGANTVRLLSSAAATISAILLGN